QPRSFLHMLTLFTPRLAWGAAVLIGLGVAASLMLPRQNQSRPEMLFAKNEQALSRRAPEARPSPTPDSSRTDTLAAAPAMAHTEVAQEKDSLNFTNHYARQRAVAEGNRSLSLNAPSAAPQPNAGGGGLAGGEKRKEAVSDSSLAATSPAPARDSESIALERE